MSCWSVLSVTLVYCDQTVGWIKTKLGKQVGLGPGNIVLNRDRSPPPPKGHSPQFSANTCCGQIAGWIKMALGMEVGLGPGYIVLDGTQLPCPKRGQSPPIFGPFLLWQNGCVYQDTTWYGGRPRPMRHCVRWGPCSPCPKGAQPLLFLAMSAVAKRLNGLRCHLVWR